MTSRVASESQRDRKRKNADAQAQFRQRRANYISSLEETVTKLEAVVVELQDCLRDAKEETTRADEDKQQILDLFQHLRQELVIREQAWKDAWVKQLPETPFPVSSLSPLVGSHSPHLSPSLSSCLDPNLPSNYQTNSPRGPVISADADQEDFMGRTSSSGKMPALGTVSKADRVEDDRKLLLSGTSPWAESSRIQVSPNLLTKRAACSMHCEPAASSSMITGTKSSAKRKSRADSPQSHFASSSSAGSTPSVVTHHLHTRMEHGDAMAQEQSSMKLRSEEFHSNHFSETGENFSQHDLDRMSMGMVVHTNGRDMDDSMSNELSRISPPISNTLAVIKATAFGALRRNRSQRKRGDNHATKVALEALEARGLGLGLQPTMTLSSVHSMSIGSPTDETRHTSLPLDESLLDDQAI